MAAPIIRRVAGAVTEADDVLLDSGARQHYFPVSVCGKNLYKARKITDCTITTAGGNRLPGIAKGTLGRLSGVIAVKGLTMQLISIGQLLRVGTFVKIAFTRTNIFGIKSDGTSHVIGHYDKHDLPIASKRFFGLDKAKKYKDQHVLRSDRVARQMGTACAAVASAKVDPVTLLHQRLMGAAKSTLSTIVKGKLLEHLPSLDKIKAYCGFCESCIEAKMTKLPFNKKSRSDTTDPGELIHFDVFGPLIPLGMKGDRYVLVLVDDFTRICWAIPMTKK